MNASEMIVEYLQEARASEDALVRVLQSQIAMAPAGSFRSGLEAHLRETRRHSHQISDRINVVTGGRNPLRAIVGAAESVIGQTLALAKAPLDLLRGSGGEEKVLKNAKDAAATEALEIATYTALERLADSVGDDRTSQMARSIRTEEQDMLERILREIPALTDAVARSRLHDDPSYDVTRTGAGDAVREIADDVADMTEATGDAARRVARPTHRVPGAARAEGAARGAVAKGSDLPITRYDDLTVDEITARLSRLTQAELAMVDAYERRHAERTTVLSRVQSLQGDEPWPGYDELTVGEIRSVLTESDRRRVERSRDYELGHKNRTGVLRAADRQLASS